MKTLITFLLFISPIILFANGSAGEDSKYESVYVVDMPTAGIIEKGNIRTNTLLMQGGGLIFSFDITPFKNFTLGLSYGGNRIIGVSTPTFQDYPGIKLKYRLINEDKYLPAFALGFESQGVGIYDSQNERFQTLSPGFYLASSKAFKWPVGILYLHAGINYSIEPKPNDRSVNFYFGAEQTVFGRISLLGEINLTLEDNSFYLEQNGLINAGIKWAAAENITLSLLLRDLTANYKANEVIPSSDVSESIVRFIGIEYIAEF